MSDLFLITDEKALSFYGSEVRKIEVHLRIKRDIEDDQLDDINSLDEVLQRMNPIRKIKLKKSKTEVLDRGKKGE